MIYIIQFFDYSRAETIIYFSDSGAVHRNKGHMTYIEPLYYYSSAEIIRFSVMPVQCTEIMVT